MPIRTKPWHKLKADACGASCSTDAKAATSGSFLSSRIWKRSATSSTSGSSCGSTSWPRPAPTCGGTRLNPDALAVRIGTHTIADVSGRSIDGVTEWLARPRTQPVRARGRPPGRWSSSTRRLEFLRDVGLGYLTLDRQTRTLSGGEAQRISLANALGLPTRGHALRAGRALRRPSPTRHRPPAGAAAPSPRCRQHRRWSWSTTLRPSGRRTSCWSSGPGAGEHGGRVVHAGPGRRRGRSRSPASISPARSASPCRVSAGRPARSGSGFAAPRCTIFAASTPTFRSEL